MLVDKMLKLDWANLRNTYSSLRGTVRCKNNVPGSSTEFYSTDGHAIECKLEEYFTGDWIEDTFEEHMNNPTSSEMFSIVAALALNRRANKIIIDALCNSPHTIVGADRVNVGAVCDVLQRGQQEDVAAVVHFEQWNLVKHLAEMIDVDIEDGQKWFGIDWNLNSELPLIGDKRRCFIYHRSAIGFADSGKFNMSASWHAERASTFVNTSIKMGAVVINPQYVFEIQATEEQ